MPRHDEQRLPLLDRDHRRRLRGSVIAGVAAGILLILAYAAPSGAETPRVDYMIQCMGCHLDDGTGKPGAVPDLAEYTGKFASFPEGRAYLIRVPGNAQSRLDAVETAALMNWMLAQFAAEDLPSDFAPFTAEEVARYRETPMLDVGETRKALVRRLGREPGGY